MTWGGSVLRALAAAKDPDGFFRRQATRTTPFTVHFPGMGEVLFVGTKDGARDVLTTPADLCQAPRPNTIEPIVGEGSLILVSGEHHRRVRGLLTPALRGEQARPYADMIAVSAIEAVEPLRPGDMVTVQQLAQNITLDVIIRVMFGVTGQERRHTYAHAITELMQANTTPLMLFPALRRQFGGVGPWARLIRLRDHLDELLAEDIRRRWATGPKNLDMLNLLLSTYDEYEQPWGEAEILQQLRTLLAAGHETSATALTWALYHIYRDDDLHRRLLDELAGDPSPQQLAELPYLEAIISETLRVHPPVSIVLRRLTGPRIIDGVARREGDVVGIALPALHFNPSLWDDPDRFDPERFLGRRPSPFQYVPFGGGHRRCIGASFATTELAVIIGTIVGGTDLHMPENERLRTPPRTTPRGITMTPSRPIVLETLGSVSGTSVGHQPTPHARLV